MRSEEENTVDRCNSPLVWCVCLSAGDIPSCLPPRRRVPRAPTSVWVAYDAEKKRTTLTCEERARKTGANMPIRASHAASPRTMDQYATQFKNQAQRPTLKIQTDPTKVVIRDQTFPLPDIYDSNNFGRSGGSTRHRRSGSRVPTSPKPQVDSSTAIELGLEEAGVHYVTEIRDMKLATTRLDLQLKKVRAQIESCRKVRSKIGGQKAYFQALKKEKAVLNNWEAAVLMWTTRKNEVTAVNAKKREQINSLRREKMIMDKTFTETRNTLENTEDEIVKVMKDADMTNRAIEQAKSRLSMVWDDHEQQLERIEQGIQHVDEIVNNSRKKSLEIMKSIEGQKLHDFDAEAKKKVMEKETQEASMEASMMHSSKKKKRFVKTYTPAEYETAFKELKDHSGIDDINDCIAHFLEENEEQFVLYKKIQSLNEKIEDIGDQKDAILKQFMKEQEEDESKNAAARAKLKQFQDKLDRIRQNSKADRDRLDMLNAQFEQCAEGLSNVFTGLGCDVIAKKGKEHGSHKKGGTATMMEFLGAAITQQNIMRYLGVIEQRAGSILLDYRNRLEQEGKNISAYKHFIAAPKIETGTLRKLMKIESPTMKDEALGDGYESKAEKEMLAKLAAANNAKDDVPHTKEELRAQYAAEIAAAAELQKPGKGGRRRRKRGTDMMSGFSKPLMHLG